MSKSIVQKAWEAFRDSDPGWTLEAIPVSGSSDVALVAARMDPYMPERKQYGSVVATYKSASAAEKTAKLLNARKAKQLSTAYP